MNYRSMALFGLAGSLAAVSVAGRAQSIAQSKRTAVKNAALLNKLKAQPASLPVHPVVGRFQKITVKKGQGLLDIARANGVSVTALRRVNGLGSDRVKAGQRLLLPTLHIVPRDPGDGIVLNVPERALYVVKGGQLEARYPVAVGQSSWQTALGQFSIRKKLKNPPWKPTKEMIEREGLPDEVVPPGANNPLGDRWIGWTAPGFGFHGTIAPKSIGTAASHGCVRLYPEAAHRLFDQVSVGMPIYSVYEPVVVGKLNGKVYLAVFPDIYHTGLTSMANVQKQLALGGLLEVVDPAELRKIVARADGYPHRIIGTDEPLTVNGTLIRASILPTRVRGQWVVPVREVAEALGAKLTNNNGLLTVAGDGRSLQLKPGAHEASMNGTPVKLAVAPTIVQGTTMVPLGVLTRALGARVALVKGRGAVVTSGGRNLPNGGGSGGGARTVGTGGT